MNTPDLINGAFELAGGILCFANVKRLYRDKVVQGIYWPVQAFFFTWGVWNLFYYPSLHQWFSFLGGLLLVIGNGSWVLLAIRYRNHKTIEQLTLDLK